MYAIPRSGSVSVGLYAMLVVILSLKYRSRIWHNNISIHLQDPLPFLWLRKSIYIYICPKSGFSLHFVVNAAT